MKPRYLLTLLLGLFCHPLLADQLVPLTPQQLQEMQQNEHALVVDVRSDAEWQSTGIIGDSYKLQSFDASGKFDGEKWLADLQQLKSSPDQPVILVCRSGNRSGKVGEFLIQHGATNVYHLNGGIQAWLENGQPLKPNCLTVVCR